MDRLIRSGFRLIPLGGDDGKRPLRRYAGQKALSLRQILGPLHDVGSASYGVLLGEYAVIDCDDDDVGLVTEMEARFGASPVHVQTPRGLHLYYRHEDSSLPNLRGDGYPVDIKHGANSYVVGPHSVRPDGGIYFPVKGVLGIDSLPILRTAPTETLMVPASAPAGFARTISAGSRHNALTKLAIEMVELVESYAQKLVTA